MTTKLAGGKKITRELDVIVHDAGARELQVMLTGDGIIYLRAKGRDVSVVWNAAALYEKGIKEGRVMKKLKRTVIKEKTK
jgi:hypothetical protein